MLLVPLAVALTGPVRAEGLRQRLNALLGRKEQIQGQIRAARQQQASATDRLWDAQKQLHAAQGRLVTARGQLAQTRTELTAAQAQLARLEKRVSQHQADVQAQLLALYKSGQPGYLNVVMQADSFSDFANRNRFVSAIVNQDAYLLQWLSRQQDQADRQRTALATTEQQRARLVTQISRDQATAQQKQAEVTQILHEANVKRTVAEEEYAQEGQEENELQAMVRARMAHAGGGGGYAGSYSGKWSGRFSWPVEGPITSPFGARINPVTHRASFHEGADIGASWGTPIHAADKGLVISTGWKPAYGQVVALDNGSGFVTWYCHCSAILVSEGQLVSRGQVIARVGATGWATGPHLHFGVLKDGDWVNPLDYLGR
jgi:murein DD-endopeptidase MepM/ murein hydrolase activator NlpD